MKGQQWWSVRALIKFGRLDNMKVRANGSGKDLRYLRSLSSIAVVAADVPLQEAIS